MPPLCRAIAAVAAIACGLGAAPLGAEPAVQTAATTQPELDYLQYCSGCHQADGSGSASNRVPRLPDSVSHFTRTTAGRAFLVQVGGVAQSPLGPEAIAALLNWLLPHFDRANLPSGFSAYTAAEVQAALVTRPADIAGLRGRLAAELAQQGHVVARY